MKTTMSKSLKWPWINYRLIAIPLAVFMASAPASAQTWTNGRFQENLQRGWDRLEQRQERKQEELKRRSGAYW
jgi:hypothetical protein